MRTFSAILVIALTVISISASPPAREEAASRRPNPPTETPEDRQIRKKIERRLFWSPLVDNDHVEVRVTNAVAVLRGAVEGWDSYGAAIEKAFEGNATLVRVELRVPGYSFKTLGDGTYEAWRDPPVTRRGKRRLNDRKLQRKIERQLFWSPFVDKKGVQVRVQNGTAVLTGTVDDWSSHGGATENAFEGGAVVVRNLLTVQPARAGKQNSHSIKPRQE